MRGVVNEPTRRRVQCVPVIRRFSRVLAHPAWTGIGAIAAVAAVVVPVVIYTGGDSASSASQDVAQTFTVGRPSTPSVTVTAGDATIASDPDSRGGYRSIATESSEEFFGGDLVVSISRIESRDRESVITRLVLRAGLPVVECEFREVPDGEVVGAVAGERLYWVEVRRLYESSALIAAFNQPTLALSELDALDRRCTAVMTAGFGS